MGGLVMAWRKPKVTEVCIGMEINSYASAEL
ncbi:MAG: pyrroloquinoline quinone precursor peptide PqqA [Magnetovibrio sp.]|nr:pyrroloquinoline quinone precursor peptide PqqA [Magnetovibrio sp.]